MTFNDAQRKAFLGLTAPWRGKHGDTHVKSIDTRGLLVWRDGTPGQWTIDANGKVTRL